MQWMLKYACDVMLLLEVWIININAVVINVKQ